VESDGLDGREPPDVRDDRPGEVATRPGPQHRRKSPAKSRHPRRRTVIETVVGLLVAILIAFGLRTFVLQAYFVPSSSMAPTLQVGDRILVDKFDFNYHSLRPGDIIVFRTPPAAKNGCLTTDGDLVKRVVAIGGQTIKSRGDEVLIKEPGRNSKFHLLPESYFPDDGRNTPLGPPIMPYTVPKNDFYVLGDNRIVSCDSRVWGALPGRDIVGRVIAVIWRHWHPEFIIF